ncbi:MAG: creatininase family protein [Pseudomonadota bacterium]
MRLDLAAWPDVETYLKRANGLIIPIGSTEQHGPTGALGTDALCAEAIARAVGAEIGVYVGPCIQTGMALHHLAFPGTIALRPTTLIALMEDYVLSLARHGFRRFLFLNGHGGNEATARAGFAQIYDAAQRIGIETADMRCMLRNWWDAAGVRALARTKFGAADGAHATASEIAVVKYLHGDDAPDCARVLQPEIAPMGPIFGAADFRNRHPDGRMGSNPALANAEAGRALFELAVAGLATAARDALAAD